MPHTQVRLYLQHFNSRPRVGGDVETAELEVVQPISIHAPA